MAASCARRAARPPALLPSSDEVILGVPAAALSWHQVTLPQGSMSGAVRLRSVLNGLLEDRLLDDPESLHFALEPSARRGGAGLGGGLQPHLAAQRRAGAGSRGSARDPHRSRVRAPPAGSPPMVFAIGDPDAALCIVCGTEGVATLPLDAAGVALAGPLPADTTALAEPAVAELAESVLGRRLPIVKPAERWLQASRSPWDLAQFDLASTGRARAGKKVARHGARAVARRRNGGRRAGARWPCCWRSLVGLNAWAWKERNALDAKRGAVRSLLTQTFPAVKLVVDAPVQMAREVAALQQATGGVTPSDLEPMLVALAASLPPGRVPTAIDFSAGQLRLRGLGLPAAEFTSVKTALSSRGYSARTESDLLLVQAEAPR